MFLKILINYLIGYVNITVEGFFIERFINICISKKIALWNIKRNKSTFLNANIGISDFKRLKQVAKKTKCRVSINSKRGLPFFIFRYKKRKIFFIFSVLFIASIFVLNLFVWNIEIEGVDNINTSELLEILNENDIYIGAWKSNINTVKAINSIRLKRDDIAWVGIELRGTNVKVKIAESDLKPDVIDEDDYCNIVSDKDGIIVKVVAKNGTPVVKENDIVKKGSVLIEGIIEGKYTGTRYVHSNGEVLAKVWYSKKKKISLEKSEYVRTGKFESKYCIRIKNFVINLYKTLPNFQNYDKIEEEKKLKIFSDFYLPVEIIKTTYYETELSVKHFEFEEAKQETIRELEEELNSEIVNKDNIITKQVNLYESDDGIEAELIYEVLENIGIDEKIAF